MTVPFSIIEVQMRDALAPFLGEAYSGDLDRFLCRDLGLSIRNYADFVKSVERREGTALLQWLVDESEALEQPPIWKRFFGARSSPRLRDVTVREFCDQVRYLYHVKQSEEEIERRKYGPPHFH